MSWLSIFVLVGSLTVSSAFSWNEVTPSKHLKYHDCYGDFKCARLRVPLDYHNDTDTRTVTIAIIKYPAAVPDTDPTFSGPIFSNPGGPGGSGVSFLQDFGLKLRNLADIPGVQHYEIVSFDPRGVGHSTPQVDFLPRDLITRNAMLHEMRGSGSPKGDDSSVPYRLAILESMNRLREQNYVKKRYENQIAEHVGTASVARDMIEMMDRIEESRRAFTSQLSDSVADPGDHIELKRLAERSEDVPRLQYIGFSYGTVLGNYLASMFPGRVGRMVLDGTSDSVDYATGPGWLSHIADTDKLADAFFKGCHDAGPKTCALARHDDKSLDDLTNRFNSWLRNLEHSPQSVESPTDRIVVVTAADVRSHIGQAMYNPIRRFRTLAVTLDQAMRGNLTTLVQGLPDYEAPNWTQICPIGNTTIPHLSLEEGFPILCGDGDDVSRKNLSWWQDYVRKEIATSSIYGSFWSTIRMYCVAWRTPAKWAFKGPFTTPKARTDVDGKPISGYPAAPILFLANRLDPVSPLRSARAMAANHLGSRIVIQESIGHCTMSAGQGTCTKNIVAEYLHTGKVPGEKETICPAVCGPWDETCGTVSEMGFERHRLFYRGFPLGLS